MNAKNHLERILYIDMIIREKTYPSKKRFSEYFEVSDKTIERDFVYLRDRLNAPLEYSKEKRGYYYTEDAYFLPSLVFNDEELFALGLSLEMVRSLGNPSISENLSKGFSKLFKFLPDKIIADLEKINSRSLFAGPPSVKINTDVWKTLISAITNNRKINAHYKTPGYEYGVDRLLHPYYLLSSQGMWYVLSYNEIRDRIESYAVHRFTSVELLKETFTVPRDFDINQHIDKWWGIFSKDEIYRVKIKFDDAAAVRIVEKNWPEDYRIIRKGEAELFLEFKTNQLESVLYWVLPWGENAEILEPPLLREMMIDTIKKMKKKYEKTK